MKNIEFDFIKYKSRLFSKGFDGERILSDINIWSACNGYLKALLENELISRWRAEQLIQELDRELFTEAKKNG